MKNWRTLTAVAASVALLAGCTTNPYTGEQQAGKVGVYGGLGAVAGAAVGAATSSKKDRKKGALIGAAVGGLAAGGYGAYVDQQEAKLRQTLVNSGVQVQRQGDNLILIMPGNITFASSSADISAGARAPNSLRYSRISATSLRQASGVTASSSCNVDALTSRPFRLRSAGLGR